MELERNKSLKPYNTFGIDAKARWFAEVETEGDLLELMKEGQYKLPKLIIGGGSNILLTGDFEGLVIHNNLKGVAIIKEDENHAWVRAMSGEVWHDLVQFALKHELGGIENLSLIPGSAGAAPMQNIGAYGVELEEVFDHLEAIHLATGQKRKFDAADCRFGYRDSVFKKELKGEYFITAIILRLNKGHQLNISYRALQEWLEVHGEHNPDIHKISEAVCRIRSSKLPDPAQIGNAGSFFKNPEVSAGFYGQLKKEYPDIPSYPLPNGNIKVPAGWLIEKAGWKGKKIGNTGSHARQALVLVNYGGATGKEVKALAEKIQQSVKSLFGIELQPEVNFI